ncbi:transcriptional regulator family protein [Collimonas pratensis]|uniref:Transcriptional regulator family protein n=1 Tax=Collimonas pratensis TaxID=279113 RepID=A0A127Q6T6_9BURK|nr:Rrf2 family transcriptional regulator [Collimonas pratensis]AMP05744.1 transcriptional regulator family protein [Collimonas pratensis]
MLHVLLHMARHDQPFTSEQISKMLNTNPVVVRRTMAGLREAGYVRSEKGHGGGWTIVCDLKKITLLDVHKAVGGPQVFAIGNESDNPECVVERVVNAALDDVLRQAESLIIKKLGRSPWPILRTTLMPCAAPAAGASVDRTPSKA